MGDAIVIASDHRGTKLKAALRERLEARGHPVTDVGAWGDDSVDYPDFAAAAARAVSRGDVPRGIVICGVYAGIYVGLLVKLGIEPEERAVLAGAGGKFGRVAKRLARFVRG